MSHLKSYNNFDFDLTRTTHSTRSFAAGPTSSRSGWNGNAGGKSVNRGHDLTHLDARAFNSFPRIPEETSDGQIIVHTATTVETTPVSPEFPPFGSEDGLTVHLGDVVPVLGHSADVQFVLEEDVGEKGEEKVKGKD
jgi:hypothetical protein